MTVTQIVAAAALFATLGRTEIVKVNLPDVFQGQQTGIGSWYQADSQRDQTNGKSWCGFAYQDDSPLFAPSLKLMGGATWGSNPQAWKEQTAKFCGLEAKVTDPATGKSQLLYIGDSFAQPRSDGSIDIMLGAFTGLNGDPNQNKDTVIKNVQWELTGNQNTDWMAPGAKPQTSSTAGNSSSSDSAGSDGNSGSGSSPTTLQTMTKTASASGHKKTQTGGNGTSKGKKGSDCKKRR